jgi:hypothetical protein
MTRVLLVGLPRSGTTWVASMLASAEQAALVFEPDNHLRSPFALRAKVGLAGGYYPSLAPDDEAPVYAELWLNALGLRGFGYTPVERLRRAGAWRAFGRCRHHDVPRAFRTGGTISPRLHLARALAVPDRPSSVARDVVVKSVYAPRSVEWIASQTNVQIVVLFRNLLNVVSSWLELGWVGPPDADELTVSDPLIQERDRVRSGVGPVGDDWPPYARLAWFLGLLTLDLQKAARRNPSWRVVRHEDLCADPVRHIRALAGDLGLNWTDTTDAQVAASDRPGRAFETSRVAAEAREAWRSRLTSAQALHIESVLVSLGLTADGSSLADSDNRADDGRSWW